MGNYTRSVLLRGEVVNLNRNIKIEGQVTHYTNQHDYTHHQQITLQRIARGVRPTAVVPMHVPMHVPMSTS